jgi:hypothetical protein
LNEKHPWLTHTYAGFEPGHLLTGYEVKKFLENKVLRFLGIKVSRSRGFKISKNQSFRVEVLRFLGIKVLSYLRIQVSPGWKCSFQIHIQLKENRYEISL